MSSFSSVQEAIDSIEMNEERFLLLLEKLIGESKYLQNSPSQDLHPQEDKASDHVLEILKPYSNEFGGPLEIKRVTYIEGRGNVIIKYPGTTDNVCSFVGSHLDVVTANANDGWEYDPFKLTVKGDELYGRGTTDCLGHVALLTDILASLAEKRIPLKTTLVVIFIANEESSAVTDIGVDRLSTDGHMDALKHGPVFWVDSADSQPCIGTAGVIQWQLTFTGKGFHSGIPHHGINAIEFALDGIDYIQQQFYKEFPAHEKESEYNFACSPTMKPTQIETPPGSLNQIPNSCTVKGDIRISPFYDIADVRIAIERYVSEINENPNMLVTGVHGPHSHYILPEEGKSGRVDLTWVTQGENGIACSLDSIGHRALCKATLAVLGECKPYSVSGSLPLVRDMQESGFDLQICGYGTMKKYHAANESANLQDFKKAVKIISKVIAEMEASA